MGNRAKRTRARGAAGTSGESPIFGRESGHTMSETESPAYANPTGWVNYGDVNPEPHGGLFVKWDGDGWEIVRTVRNADICAGADADDERQHVEKLSVYPDDVFVDGEPENGLTDRMKDILETLGDTEYDPDEYPEQPTEYAPEFLDRIGYYVADMIYHYSGRSALESGDYDDILEKHGVEEWDD